MGKSYTEIDEALARFIRGQSVFFVATAPDDPEGHLNLSPKGLDTLRILDSKTVAYLDLIGSGVETLAHLKENGRIVLMFCAFQGSPMVLRLHGRGRVIELGNEEFADLASQFPDHDAKRAIILVQVERISTSCGYAVPLLKYEGEREQYFAWARKKGVDGLKTYRREKNRQSIDGLPALEFNEEVEAATGEGQA
ncbi:MAG TPA: pyridoxamine 5'-phosphate oxidase family protein [Candidatus Sulfotelmatobacter sp.]|nr:pyridoxamine 5'-phosphate oxidase family protein [Candidatus Sulfotelmatobacter sp.]